MGDWAGRSHKAPDMASARRSTLPTPLDVHIVEDHGQVLEHLYDAIGAKRTPFSNLDWVHFDSHPDLSLPPALSASTVREPFKLFDALEQSEGGNSEFILPAVFAGHLARVCWVRPPWARQLPDGFHGYHVGVEKSSGCLRVSLPVIYYYDERLHCSSQDMEPEGRKALNLRVCTADDHKTLFSVLPVVQGGWVLDICLDYFSTQNPFLVALEEDQGPAAREAVLAYFQAPHFRRKEALEAVPEEVKAEMAAFLRLTRELINLFEVSGVSMTNERVTAIREELDPLMGSNLPRETSQSVTNAFVEVLARGDSALFEILRSLGGHCASLPSHCSSWEEIDAMIAQTAKAVEGLCQAYGCPPSVVFLARSVLDGYTPQSIGDALQEKVLDALRTIQLLGPLRVLAHYLALEEEESGGE